MVPLHGIIGSRSLYEQPHVLFDNARRCTGVIMLPGCDISGEERRGREVLAGAGINDLKHGVEVEAAFLAVRKRFRRDNQAGDKERVIDDFHTPSLAQPSANPADNTGILTLKTNGNTYF